MLGYGPVIRNYREDFDEITQITGYVNIAFDALIVIIMFMSFFALSSNMSANLYEQTKEIGVLRSIGFTNKRIKLLYFYEALVLVLASSTLGVMVGVTVGYTMTLEYVVYMESTVGFFFPWTQFICIFVLSIICAALSTCTPTSLLLKKQISAIFRSG